MSRRFATAYEIEAAPVLPIALPPSKHQSDPISQGEKPELYLEADLKKVVVQKHERTDEFEKRLVAIWWRNGEKAVPFIFRTQDGKLRSLDAGCVGFLLNKQPPDCKSVPGDQGYVVGVIPLLSIVERYLPIKPRLIGLISTS